MIILVGHQKGGCGKSTVATNFATILAHAGKDVVLVDSDRQESSHNWAKCRLDNEDLKPINSIQIYGDKIHNSLLDLNKRYEYILVDVAGRDSAELRSAMVVADICISPFMVSQFDLETTEKFDVIIEQSKIVNDKLRVFALLNGVSNHHKDTRANDAADYLKEFENLEVLQTRWHRLTSFSDVVRTGHSVVEYTDAKAKQEAIDLVQEVLNAIGSK